jgi:transcriptional regulator with XRE-family HTH domain
MPELNEINWSEVINKNPDVLEGIVGDVVKVDGKRRKVSRQDGTRRLNQVYEQDFSERPFQDSFRIICGKDSLRTTAAKTGISYSHVFHLKSGNATPTIEMMENIAIAYNREPSYFLEYRIHFVLASMTDFLMKNPETATAWFNKSRGMIIR